MNYMGHMLVTPVNALQRRVGGDNQVTEQSQFDVFVLWLIKVHIGHSTAFQRNGFIVSPKLSRIDSVGKDEALLIPRHLLNEFSEPRLGIGRY